MSWFAAPERLGTFGRNELATFADHDRQIAIARENVFGDRPAPTSAIESHIEAAELRRLVLHRAGDDPQRAEWALRLVELRAQDRFLTQLRHETVSQAREAYRGWGICLLGGGVILLGITVRIIRRWREPPVLAAD